METFRWRYTHPRDGRVTTKDHFTEAAALRILPEPARVEGSQVLAKHAGHVGWAFASGSSGSRMGRWFSRAGAG